MLHKLKHHEMNQLLSEFKDCVLDKYEGKIDKIYLFGSYARGDNDAESDIDLCIVLKGNKEHITEFREVLWDVQCELGLKYNILISVIVKTKEEFEQRQKILPFYMNILNEGVALYG